MKSSTAGERVPGYRLQPTLEAVHRFRNGWSRHHRPDDVNHLLRLFRKVDLQSGYILDYMTLGRQDSGRIWPFARPDKPGPSQELPAELKKIAPDQLAGQQPGKDMRQLEAKTLYSYLSYERTPLGLCEYAFFIPELWALKSQQIGEEWLSLEPLVVRHAFDAVLRKAGEQLVRVTRPQHYDPVVQLDPKGGWALFMAYQPGPWRRIVRIELAVDPIGSVSWRPREVVASLQRR
jgi:hypothetical protein